jgi:hypothetical protein
MRSSCRSIGKPGRNMLFEELKAIININNDQNMFLKEVLS